MKSIIRASIVLLALFAGVSSLYAQTTPVRGKVVKSGTNGPSSMPATMTVQLVSKDGKVMDTKSLDPQGACIFDVSEYKEGTYSVRVNPGNDAKAACGGGPTVVCKGTGSPKSAGFKNGAAIAVTGGDTCGNYTCSVACADGDTCAKLKVVVTIDTTKRANELRRR